MTSRITTWDELTNPTGTEVLAVDDLTTHKKISIATLRTGVPSKTIVVSYAGTETVFSCVADGVTDDRTQVKAAVDLAAANTPSVVEFGVGDFAVSGGMDVTPPAGSQGLVIRGAGNGATRLSFAKNASLTGGQFIMFTIKPSVEPTVGDFANYLKDVTIEDINFFDKFPEAHTSFSLPSADISGGTGYALNDTVTATSVSPVGGTGCVATVTGVSGSTITELTVTNRGSGYHNTDVITFSGGATAKVLSEESHAIKLRYTINGSIKSCGAEDIGDEGFDLNYVNGGSITNCTTLGTPSYGAGSAINVQFCEDIILSDNTIQGSQDIGTRSTMEGSGGIAVEMVSGILQDMKNISIVNNTLKDLYNVGIYIANAVATTELSNLIISNNSITNCGTGLSYSASPTGKIKGMVITSNVIKDVDAGIVGAVAVTDNQDCVISGNIIQDVNGRGLLLTGSNMNVTDNTIKNTTDNAIRIGAALDVSIRGGIIDNCGGTSIQTIVADADGKEISVDGVTIINSNSTTQVVLNCERVTNCRINQVVPKNQQVWSANYVANNTLNGGIGLDGNSYGAGMIIGNKIDTDNVSLNGDVIVLTSANANCVVSNNYIKTTHGGSLHREAILINSGSTNNLISNNVTVSETPSLGIIDNGTGTLLSGNQEI